MKKLIGDFRGNERGRNKALINDFKLQLPHV